MLTVSLITASYQSAATIADAVQSVQDQDYPHIEHILIDGASTDGTLDTALATPNRISYSVSEPDAGMYHAMNKGLARATGDIIGILNADDCLAHPQVISHIVSFMEAHQLDGCYGDLLFVSPTDSSKIVRRWKGTAYDATALARGWAPAHPTFYVRKAVYDAHGGFDTRYSIAADMELMFRFLAKHRINVAYLEETLVHMRSGGASNGTLSGILRANWQTYRGLRACGVQVSPLYMLRKLARKVPQLFDKAPSQP